MKLLFKEFIRGKTIARALLNVAVFELVRKNPFLEDENNVLEIGSVPASHHKYLPEKWRLVSSNYRPLANIELVVDAEKEYPLAADKFDGVICFNTLYIIKNYRNFINESLRVSRKFILFNIFLNQAMVAEPHDYTRMTEDRLVSLIGELKTKFKIAGFEIVPVGGSFSSAVSLIDPYLKFRLIKVPLYYLAILFDKLDKKIKRRCPIMYLVLIKKDEAI